MSVSAIGGGTDTQAMYGMGQRPPKPTEEEMETMATDFISQLDTDVDGVLSIDEAGVDEESFAEIDTDGDGFVTTEEMTTAMAELGPPPPPPGAGMAPPSDDDEETSTVSAAKGAEEYKTQSNALMDLLFQTMGPGDAASAATQGISLTA